MQSILPNELRGLINSEHGNQESKSLFGEVYYEINDTTKITAGLRYDENDAYFMLLNTLGDATPSEHWRQHAQELLVVFCKINRLWLC
ncbi:MAG: hypothetical protein CM15mP98_04710 [Paracoccaceae bacterium]|nr:MAG: hypothetical protein CM15mP98_04710 [Paracoccaceae bacterium]